MWANTKKNDLAEDITNDNISADVLEAQHEELKVCHNHGFVETPFIFLYSYILKYQWKLSKKLRKILA